MAKRILALVMVFMMILPLIVACNSEPDGTTGTTGTIATSGTTGSNQNNNQNNENNNQSNNENNNQNNNEDNNVNNENKEESVFDEDPFEDGKLSLKGVDISEYVIVTPVDPVNSVKYFAEDLADWVKDITGKTINIVEDSTAATDKEILVGDTNRAESTTAKSALTTEQKSYNAVVTESGKVAIAFNHKNGSVSALNAFQRSFANNDCNVTEGFTNTKIALEDVKDLVMGAVRKEMESDGLHVYKCTQAQVDAWHAHTANWNGNKENPRSSLGIRIDVDTDSSYISVTLSKSVSNLVLLLNDELVDNAWSGNYYQIPAKDLGKVNRVTILMSNVGYSDQWAITGVEGDGGCKIVRHKTDLNILFLGDSITEGYNNHGHPASTYTFYTHTYFNAEAVVQGHGGSQLWPDMVDPAMASLYQPDVIIVAMGTNDYSGNRNQSVEWFRNRMDAFLDKVEQVYPGVPIIGITPIRRLNEMNSAIDPELNYDKNCVERANAGYALGIKDHKGFVVDGSTLLSKVEHYADTVHPNEEGFKEYGKWLCFLIEEEIARIVAAKNKK